MIVYPKTWRSVGAEVTPEQIEYAIISVLSEIDCNCLSLSGGIDSSLLLYFMTKVFGTNIKCFTIACSTDHPDCVFSSLVCQQFDVDHEIYLVAAGVNGNVAVKSFYDNLHQAGIKKIVTGDGVDEYNCGYYVHLNDPSEETYYDLIRKLYDEHLSPLDKNSGNVEVALPYVDDKLLLLFSQIPIFEKVDGLNRKKMLIRLAEGKLPDDIIYRRKYGFCDAGRIK